jgi:hypothetical protein
MKPILEVMDMTARKKAGVGLVVFGALNILDFFSPIPIPTVGISAFVVGGLFIGAGFLMMNLDALTSIRFSDLLKSRKPLSKPSEPSVNPLLPVRILELAKANGGKLTISEVAIAMNIGLEVSEAALSELLQRGDARADVSLATGVTTYRFPEFLSPEDEKESSDASAS